MARNILYRTLKKFGFKKEKSNDINIKLIGGGRPTITINEHTYINKANLYCWRTGLKLEIGSYCSFAENVDFILGGEHDTEWVSTFPFIERWQLSELKSKVTPKSRGDITIGNDVWIGHGVTILSGSTIGTGSIIGAGATVRGNIPPYSIAVGLPARVIKRRFSTEICESLLKSKWWLLPQNKLKDFVIYMDDPIIFLRELNNAGLTND
ncbi:2,3,4,5-tetrahydropyridine-2,6-dicarboxylate N-acetyltransferase [Rhodoferax lithotrophicus]|uniref:2,3,4,5-tetrahydropyridine-2,6-dicarboxylate N-acetyltransferase n=1 Tax=Rhodoferax lithotrophicus TaxID=2798804 RepID=A0ABM7MM14_9BURK|nr:CatB-related O-acetyltransferase [Rhodoferax sp. MIZ03]BCO27356.1 2,3,4,5-tetrahydropyridine-2,6-dicarboxylate N-acetyltransferase [Rhodoferax sp. MIZ03]